MKGTVAVRLIGCAASCATSETNRGVSDVWCGTRCRRDLARTWHRGGSYCQSNVRAWLGGEQSCRVGGQAKASMAQVVGALSKRVKEVMAHSEMQASCVADALTQQLEKGLKTVTTSTTMMLE